MRVVKPLKLGLLHRTFEDGSRTLLTVTAMAFFPFGNRRQLFGEIPMWKLAAEVLGGDAPLDAAMPKTRGEFLVYGDACALNGASVPGVKVRVQAGFADKRLIVFGDRHWQFAGPSDPVRFSRMPITWQNAFGGEGFDLNPVGKGVRKVLVDGKEVQPLPNVEDASSLVSSPGSEPKPIGLTPLDQMWPQRARHQGTYDSKWQKKRFPWFPEDFDWEFFNVAPEDQRLAGFFTGDERWRIEGMHPTKAVVDGQPPELRARLFIVRKEKPGELVEVLNRVDTLLLFPNVERGVMIFRGTIPVREDDAHDVSHVVGALEDRESEPRPVSHYAEVVRNREHPEKAALFALRDRDLLPNWAKDRAAPEEQTEHETIVKSDDLMRLYLERQATRQVDQLKAQMKEAGLDTSAVGTIGPKETVPEDLDELPEFFEKQLAKVDEVIAEAEVKRQEMLDQLRASLTERGLDADAVLERSKKEGGGPPRYALAEPRIAATIELAEARRKGGAVDASAMVDPRFIEALRKTEEGAYFAYRRFTHFFPEAQPLGVDEARTLRAKVMVALDAREPMTRWDLTGADLSELDLSGQDLSDALLEGVDFRRAKLDGANLQGATLARADLRDASFAKADLSNANLALAQLQGAVLDDASLLDVCFYKAELALASLKRVRITGNVLLFAIGGALDLSGATFDTANLFELDLAGSNLDGAKLQLSSWLRCNLSGASFRGAKLKQVGFVECDLQRVDFASAGLERTVFALGTNLESATFVGATVKHSSFRGCSLKRADLSDAVFDECDFGDSSLESATMRRLSAKRSLFMRTDLRFADVRGSNLTEALMGKAEVHGADLRGVNFFRADMAKVQGDKGTQLGDAYLVQVRTVPENESEKVVP